MTPDQRKRAILLSVLLVVVVTVLWFQFFRTPSAPETIAAAVATPATAPVAQVESVFQETQVNIDELVKNIREVDFEYRADVQARDPMSPLVGSSYIALQRAAGDAAGPVRDKQSLVYEANLKHVTGIMWDPHAPMAVIKTPGVGDEVVNLGFEFEEGIHVKDIGRDHVVLSLKLEGEEVEIVKELEEQ